MSAFSTLVPLTQGISGTAPSVWSASTADSLATITTAGYLNDLGSLVKANDVFYVNYLDTSTFPLGENSVLAQFYVTKSGSNVSLTSLPSGFGSSQYTTVAITAAQFNGMYAAPKLLVAAPGANRLLVLEQMQLLMTYGTAAYAAGGVVAVQWDSTANGAGVIASTTIAAAAFQATASTGWNFNPGVVAETFSTTVNKGLYLSNITGAFTTGDSAMVAHVWYKTIPTA